MDTSATMTGVTKFLYKQNEKWIYTKEEKNPKFNKYTHLLTGNPDDHHLSFNVIHVENGFHRVDWKNFKVEFSPKVWIMKRKEEKKLSPDR